MVKSKQIKKAEAKALNISHPNSRKAKKLSKQIIKEAAKNKTKVGYAIKRNIFGEKLLWFRDHLDKNAPVYTGKMVEELINSYLERFDKELEMINMKHSVGQRKNRQHANREDVIKMTKSRETEEFNGGGIEIVDILYPDQLNLLRSWEGDYNFLPKFKIARYSSSYLKSYAPPKNSLSANILAKQQPLPMEMTL